MTELPNGSVNGTTPGASRLSQTTHQHGAPHGLTWAITRAPSSDFHPDHSAPPRYPMSDVPATESAGSSPATSEGQTLDLAEVVTILGSSPGIVGHAAREGRLPALRIRRRLVVPPHAFDRWLASAAEPLLDPSPTLGCRWRRAHFRLRLRLRSGAPPRDSSLDGTSIPSNPPATRCRWATAQTTSLLDRREVARERRPGRRGEQPGPAPAR